MECANTKPVLVFLILAMASASALGQFGFFPPIPGMPKTPKAPSGAPKAPTGAPGVPNIPFLKPPKGTRIGYYSQSCPRVESVVKATIKKHVDKDKTIAPGLLRLVFHDCFVNGCDASILLEGPDTEKEAGINALLRGYEVVNDVKKEVEKVCPGVVSCADILALAARDSTVEAGAMTYAVPTGRKDGRVSKASDCNNLPSYMDSVEVLKKKFADKGLDTQDLVTLSGGHTVGSVTCQVITYRLYNYTSSGGADPSIDPVFLKTLRALCPFNGDGWRHIPLDYGSEFKFDHSFFTNVKQARGVLESDQRLWEDSSTQDIVQQYIGARGMHGFALNVQFGRAMYKMTNIGLKTEDEGEIRKVCTKIN
ncbi:Peroxidase [Heracleum sosnowskyi]|uniref:Peroxidase n=1 Tax=Heracleum sosnowskyi TaxID=360622 RepID=A0AAD8H1J4_9APIA|nr:Peroxidase [Heracleum sosnowskyi]